MKKEYINPEMHVIKMQTMTVLAASDRLFSTSVATSDEDGYYEE